MHCPFILILIGLTTYVSVAHLPVSSDVTESTSSPRGHVHAISTIAPAIV